MVCAVYRAFLHRFPENERKAKLGDVSAFTEYLKSEEVKSDKCLSNLIRFWITHDIPALMCMLKGMRNNNYTLYQSGRKHLLPFTFMRNNSHYGPLMLRNILEIEVLAPPEVRLQYMEFFELNKEGFDFRLEDLNHKLKSMIPGMTYAQYLYAAIVISFSKIRENYCQNIGLKERQGNNELSINFGASIVTMEKSLLLSNKLALHPGRKLINLTSGEELLHGSDSYSLCSVGTSRILDFICANNHAFIRGDHKNIPKFPKPHAMLSSEKAQNGETVVPVPSSIPTTFEAEAADATHPSTNP
jgi:hypothetical protein